MSHDRHIERARTALAIVIVAAVTVAVHAIDSDRSSVILGGIRNSAHLPLFVFLTLLIHKITSANSLKTVATVACISLLAEGSQYVSGGEPDVLDLLSDAAGLAIALSAWRLWFASRRRLALGFVLLGFAPMAFWCWTWKVRANQMPCIADFDNPFLSAIQRPLNAEIIEANPNEVQLALQPNRYAGIRLIDPVADWSGFSQIEIMVSTTPETPITIRIHDSAHNNEHADRYNEQIAGTGAKLVIPLERIRQAPAARPLNLTQISEVTFFAVDPAQGTTLKLATPCLL
ncbi:MAG: VanZ family protein [Pseudomonadota bacterium]